MIIDSFDIDSPAIISPDKTNQSVHVDVCMTCFSQNNVDYLVKKYSGVQVGELTFATGNIPVYVFEYDNIQVALFRSYIGGPAAVGGIEDISELIDAEKFVVFGSCGCLFDDIDFAQIIVPDRAYRDEGTSYHYAAPSDFIKIRNANIVAEFMERYNVDYIQGSTWTTDAFYRETKNNFELRRADGCVCVEMEAASIQAMCDFRGYDLYCFLYGSDMLDSAEWDPRARNKKNLPDIKENLADLAVELAVFVSKV